MVHLFSAARLTRHVTKTHVPCRSIAQLFHIKRSTFGISSILSWTCFFGPFLAPNVESDTWWPWDVNGHWTQHCAWWWTQVSSDLSFAWASPQEQGTGLLSVLIRSDEHIVMFCIVLWYPLFIHIKKLDSNLSRNSPARWLWCPVQLWLVAIQI